MRHAVVLAHPDPRSLNAAIARAYAAALRAEGHSVVLRDLYRMGFDPCLKAEEIPGSRPAAFRPDVVEERAKLARADVFAFIYPLWFNAPPAILKGYVDRVFSMGFGFGPGLGGTQPQLAEKRLISFSTSGAPEFWVRDTGALTALQQVFDTHLAGVTGIQVVDHVHFGGVVSELSRPAGEDVLRQVREAAARHFPASMAVS